MLLDFKDLQRALRLGVNRTLDWCNRADTPAFKMGRKWFCRRDSLDEWLRQQERKQKNVKGAV